MHDGNVMENVAHHLVTKRLHQMQYQGYNSVKITKTMKIITLLR